MAASADTLQEEAMYQKTKVVMLYADAIESVHRLAVSVCEAVWDAGAELRVRRVGEVDVGPRPPARPETVELLQELEEIPPAKPEDLAWADVALIGLRVRGEAIPPDLERLIEAAKRRWQTGDFDNKLYYHLFASDDLPDVDEGTVLPPSDPWLRSDAAGERDDAAMTLAE
jgi:hypothetical protein